jgi:uncharacterized membrane protein YkvA (DUF1232 family)
VLVGIEVLHNWNRSAAFDSNIESHFQEQERNVRRVPATAICRGVGRRLLMLPPDPATPMRVRGILLAALAYFIVRWRSRPPLTWLWRLPGLGFTNDAPVLTALFGLSSHITPLHRAASKGLLPKN